MSYNLQTLVVASILSIALVVPKMTAALTSVLPGFSIAILCTGTAIERIVIGPDGQPVDVKTTEHAPCITAAAEGMRAPVTTDWVALNRSYAISFVVIAHPTPSQDIIYTRPPFQGPPHLSI